MEDNLLIDAFRKEFLRQVESAGFYHSAGENGDEIAYHGRLIGTLLKDCGLVQAEDLDEQGSKAFNQLQSLGERTLEPYTLFYEGAICSACDEPDTRVLSEFDRVALTASVHPDGVMQFATWQYHFDHTGVRDRCDCGTDFTAAKEQFTIRAGLMPKARIFSLGELTQLADACTYRLGHDSALTGARERQLTLLTAKLLTETARLNPRERITSPDRQEIGIRQTGVPYGFTRRRTEPGYILKDGTALLESERDAAGNYLGGAGMDGLYLKTGRSYTPVLDGDGNVWAFREVVPQPPNPKREKPPESGRGHKTAVPER